MLIACGNKPKIQTLSHKPKEWTHACCFVSATIKYSRMHIECKIQRSLSSKPINIYSNNTNNEFSCKTFANILCLFVVVEGDTKSLLFCSEKHVHVKTPFNNNIEFENQGVCVGNDDVYFNYNFEKDQLMNGSFPWQGACEKHQS